LTDVKIAKTSSGKSRQFCFIGYRNEEDAKVAKHFFNNTFIGTSKITVDFARKIGDTSLLTEAKSKYTKTKLAKNEEKQLKKQQENEKKLLQEKEKKQKQKDEQKQLHDRKKQEFLAVMKSRQVSNKWGNDEVIEENIEMNHNNIQDESLESDDDDDDDGGGGGSDSDGEGSDDDNNACNEDEPITQKTPTSSSDLDFLRSKINKKLRDDDSIEEDHTKAVGTNDKHSKKRKRLRSLNTSNENAQINDDIISNEADEAKVDEDDLQMSDFSRLFIRNLPFTCTEDDLRSSFEHYGNLTEVHIPLDLQKRSKGIGFVEFMFPESAKKALSELDGTSFQGRLLHIVPAKEKANAEMPGDSKGVSAPGNNYNGLSSYKSKKEEMRRSMAGLKDNWNSSYVRSDAVVSSIAEKYDSA
jgi:multiple RNA-binding domain-containing protein 1